MAQILLTGATGFIGRHLAPVLHQRGHVITEAGRVRRQTAQIYVPIPVIGLDTDWWKPPQNAKEAIGNSGRLFQNVNFVASLSA